MSQQKQLQQEQEICCLQQSAREVQNQLDSVYSTLVEIDIDPELTDQLLSLQREIARAIEQKLNPKTNTHVLKFYPHLRRTACLQKSH